MSERIKVAFDTIAECTCKKTLGETELPSDEACIVRTPSYYMLTNLHKYKEN